MVFTKGHKINLGNQYARGVKRTEKWKEALRSRMLGNQRGFKKGRPSPRRGKRSSKPAWNKGIKMPEMTGANNSRWKGGKSRDIHSLYNPKYREWRMKVFTRDNFQCRTKDGHCEGILQVHHIFRWADFPELRYEVDNGITLCKIHHPRKKKDELRLAQMFLSLINSGISHLIVEERKVESNIFL